MKIVRDRIPLNPQYPFAYHNHILTRMDNRQDLFHWHSYFEITCIREGGGAYLVNGKKYDMHAGDIIIFNNAELHGWIVEQESMEVDVLVFSMEFVANHNATYEYEFLKPFIERGSNFQNCIRESDQNASEIRMIIGEIRKEWEKKEAGYKLYVKSDVLRILTLLIRHYQNDVSNSELLREKKTAMKRLEEAFNLIEQQYADKITLEELSKAVYMSPNYFSTYFKRIVGKSLSEYLTEFRISKAEEMLTETDKSVTEIAMECGFRNMSNFYRQYKKVTGTTPKDHLQKE